MLIRNISECWMFQLNPGTDWASGMPSISPVSWCAIYLINNLNVICYLLASLEMERKGKGGVEKPRENLSLHANAAKCVADDCGGGAMAVLNLRYAKLLSVHLG